MLNTVLLSLRPGRCGGLLLAFLLMVPGVLCGQTAAVLAGSMPEDSLPELKAILQTAFKQSPASLQQSIYVAQAEAYRYYGDSALWPSLSGSASYSSYTAATSGSDVTTTSKGLFYGISASQPLYQWGALKAQADISRLGVKIAERQFADAYLHLAVTLRGQYLDLIARKVGLRNLRLQLKLAENDLATQEKNLTDGVISPGAIISPRLVVEEARLNLERTIQSFDYAKRVFTRLAGLDDLAEESIPVEIKLPSYQTATAESLLSSFLRNGAENTVQGQIYVYSLKQSDLSYRIAKKRLYPKFSLGGGYYLSNSQAATGSVVAQSAIASYSTGITATWTLFDGFATRGAKLSALASKRSYERQFQTYIDTSMDAAQNLRKQVGFAARALNLAETRLALAKDGFKRIDEDYKLGTRSQVEVDVTMISLNYAEQTAISARAEYLNRWSEFVSLIGADPIASILPARYLSHGK